MDFTQRELALIAKASRKASDARLIRVALLIAMLVAVWSMFIDVFESDKLAYGLFVAVLVAIAHPQLGGRPKYEDLTALLEQKSAKKVE